MPKFGGYDFALVVTCGLTRFTRVFPCTKRITGEETIKILLEEWFCVYGAPKEINSDEDVRVRSDTLSPRKLHPLFSPKHLDFVTKKNGFFCHLENTVFQYLPKNAFFIRFAHFLLFLGGSKNHSLVQNQRVYWSFSPKTSFVR